MLCIGYELSGGVCVTVQVRSLGETVRLDARTKLLNPKWYEGMLNSGYEGVREIQKRLTNTVGWSATSGQVGLPFHPSLQYTQEKEKITKM